MNDKADKGEPMDPGAREGSGVTHVIRQVRNAWALESLVEEVKQSFDDVAVTYGDPDEWQVIHEVTFECFATEQIEVLEAVGRDMRIEEVLVEDDMVLVRFLANRRTRDIRGGFGVEAILAVHREDEVTE